MIGEVKREMLNGRKIREEIKAHAPSSIHSVFETLDLVFLDILTKLKAYITHSLGILT